MCLQCGPQGAGPLVAFAFETLTVSTAALPLSIATYQPQSQGRESAIYAMITNPADGAATEILRYRFDGPAPTDTVGHMLAPGDKLEVCATNLRQLKLIRDANSTGDVLLAVTYSHVASGPGQGGF